MDAECQLMPNGSVLLTGGKKALCRKEVTQCSEWPEILCSNGNFLVLMDKCIPFCQKGVWEKSRSGTWPLAAFLPNALGNFPTSKAVFGRGFLKLSWELS